MGYLKKIALKGLSKKESSTSYRANYVKLVFEDESKIAKKFSKVDVGEIRQMLAKQHSRKQLLGARRTKRFIRQPKFKDQSVQLFLLLRVKKQQIQPSFVITAGILPICDLKFYNKLKSSGTTPMEFRN